MRRLGAVLSAATGYAVGLEASKFTYLVPGYGHIPNDDPIALLVAVLAGVMCWKVVDRLTR